MSYMDLSDPGGWMFLLDITDPDILECNLPPVGAKGPVLRYSKLTERAILNVDRYGKSSSILIRNTTPNLDVCATGFTVD